MPRIIDRKMLYDGHYKLIQLTIQDGAEQYPYELFEPGQATAGLVFDTRKERYLLVRQFRAGAGAEVLEIVAGMIDPDDESPAAALRREIQEELGYRVDRLEPIAEVYASPGNSAERHYVFYAEVSEQLNPGGGTDEHENLDVVSLSREQLLAEKLMDAKTLLAVQWAQLHKK